jgi:hypothetical protein
VPSGCLPLLTNACSREATAHMKPPAAAPRDRLGVSSVFCSSNTRAVRPMAPNYKRSFERAWPQDELAMAEHAGNRLVDRTPEPPALRGDVDERDRGGIETGALIRCN